MSVESTYSKISITWRRLWNERYFLRSRKSTVNIILNSISSCGCIKVNKAGMHLILAFIDRQHLHICIYFKMFDVSKALYNTYSLNIIWCQHNNYVRLKLCMNRLLIALFIKKKLSVPFPFRFDPIVLFHLIYTRFVKQSPHMGQ